MKQVMLFVMVTQVYEIYYSCGKFVCFILFFILFIFFFISYFLPLCLSTRKYLFLADEDSGLWIMRLLWVSSFSCSK
jgi:hypothetical protein